MNGETTQKDRRRAPRVALDRVEVVVEGYTEPMEAFAPNLSRYGMFVNTAKKIARGALVRLQFRLRDTGDEIQTCGEVRYCLEGIGVGIEFVGLSPVMQRAIQEEVDIIAARAPARVALEV